MYTRGTRSRCRRFTTRIRSRHSRRTVPIHRSTKAFARGAHTGVRIVRTPSERNTSSTAAVNLLSRSWIKNRIGSVRSTNVSMMFRACWVLVQLELDESFFQVRVGGASKAELAYLAAMASLGAGPYRSGEIAAALGRPGPESVAPTRARLIEKGLIY